jgi:hypothetical protein
MTVIKHATLSAILLAGLLMAACTSSSQTSVRSLATTSPTGFAVAATTPRATVATPQPEAVPMQQPLVPPSLASNRCPPITANPIKANPVGCPGLLPPQPIVPQAGQAHIFQCMQPMVASAPPITVAATVCGASFRPEEIVTITASGRTGMTSWQVATGRDGSFRSTLPAGACRLMPAYLSARGNRGSVSNSLPLTMAACRGLH